MESYLQQYVLNGGWMMAVLLPTSLIAVAFIVQGYVKLRASRIAPKALMDAAERLSDEKAALEFQEMLHEHPAPLGRLAAHLLRLDVVGDDPESDERETDYLRPALNDEIDRLWQETTGLATIYEVAPLMGLLGTVVGLIEAFGEFVTNPEHTVESLSTGINHALITTMWGLMIAIPSYIFVRIFRRKIFRYEKDLLPRRAKELARIVWKKKQKNR
ncbi:MAG: MotA/TolQ/ExbB proton channel family protein [Candidatus Sumerlaeota bacterium]